MQFIGQNTSRINLFQGRMALGFALGMKIINGTLELPPKVY
jgi:hypothetical protein